MAHFMGKDIISNTIMAEYILKMKLVTIGCI